MQRFGEYLAERLLLQEDGKKVEFTTSEMSGRGYRVELLRLPPKKKDKEGGKPEKRPSVNYKILRISSPDGSEVPEVVHFVQSSNSKARNKYIPSGEEIYVDSMIGNIVWGAIYEYAAAHGMSLDYFLSRVYDRYTTRNRAANFTYNDRRTLQILQRILNQDVIVVERNSSTATFPILDKSVEVDRKDESGESLTGDALKEELVREMEQAVPDDRIRKYLFQDDETLEESLLEDTAAEQAEKISWDDKELYIADALNAIFRSDGVQAAAKRVGGSQYPDIHVDFKGDEFYVEVKGSYLKGRILKFLLTFDGSGVKLSKPKGADQDDEDNENDDEKPDFFRTKEYEDDFHETMSRMFSESGYLKSAFEELGANVQKCIDSMKDIPNVKRRLKFDERRAKMFPEGFIELAKVFNFYIQEWISHYMTLKSQLLFRLASSSSPSGADIEGIVAEIDEINSKVGRILAKSKKKNLQSLDEFDKFKYMYQMFISSDRALAKKESDVDSHKYRLFTWDSRTRDPQGESERVRKEVIDNILKYYVDVKKCEYMEIESDVYRISDGVADFERLETPCGGRIGEHIHGLDEFMASQVEVAVEVKDAHTLKLSVVFFKPETEEKPSFEEMAWGRGRMSPPSAAEGGK